MKVLTIYKTSEDYCPFIKWIETLKDKVVIARIMARLTRVELGSFGDVKSVGNGVMELRFNFGSGYRIYYGCDTARVVLLLTGGDKGTQKKDVKLAHQYWNDYLKRMRNEQTK